MNPTLTDKTSDGQRDGEEVKISVIVTLCFAITVIVIGW